MQVSKLFPNMLLQVNVNASSSPHAVMKPDALNGTAEMIADFFVQLPNKTLHYICTMQYVSTDHTYSLCFFDNCRG